MNKQEKYNAIINAMEYTGDEPKNGMRANIYIIKDETPEETRKVLIDIIYDKNIGGSHDLSYEIVFRACDVISELSLEDLENTDCLWDIERDWASFYTAERLGYLNMNNQDEIIEKLKEYDSDIATACAVWYDAMVRDVAIELQEYITE